MSKRKPMDKEQVRQRRNRLLESAATAKLSIAEGVREMRAIAGMTQEEFARHREVSARVIKAIELDQGNPTLATMNRIGQFFGLEVAFVPIRRPQAEDQPQPVGGLMTTQSDNGGIPTEEFIRWATEAREDIFSNLRKLLTESLAELDTRSGLLTQGSKTSEGTISPAVKPAPAEHQAREESTAGEARPRTKRKPRSR